jgi:putative tryptophan/tyrosine transport system substrate-binding protein
MKMQNGLKWQLALIMIAAVFVSGCASQPQKTYHIGILSGLYTLDAIADSFKAKMTDLGYIEGVNVSYDVQRYNISMDGYNQAIRLFVDKKVDLVFAFPTEASIVAKNVTYGTGIPTIFAFANIENNNMVKSVTNPGENITGVRFPGPENSFKRLELMKEMYPRANRIFVCHQKGYPSVPIEMEALHNASKYLNVTLVELEAGSLSDIINELDARSKLNDTGIDAIIFIAEPLCAGTKALEAITKFAIDHKIPIGGVALSNENAIFNYANNNSDYGTISAVLADKILKGTPAGALPVETPQQMLSISIPNSKKLGISISEGFLSMADTIIR